MKRVNKNLLSIFALGLFFMLALASSGSKKTFKNSGKWIPDDFVASKQVLLIQKFNKDKTQRQAEEYITEKYPYKYEFVSLNDIYDGTGKYDDTSLYRFALISSIDHGTITTTRSNGSMSTMNVSGTDFGFYDRQLEKTLPSADKASSNPLLTFRAIINTIVKEAH